MNAKLKNIFQCYAAGMGIKGISASFNVSRNTIRKYIRMCQESALSMEQLLALPESRLRDMFCASGERRREIPKRKVELDALLPEYAARLSRKGVTYRKLYEEYHALHPDGYLDTAFRRYLRNYRLLGRVAVGHVEHLAGDQMYIDYAGDKLEIVDMGTGGVRPVEVFVAILPCSHYTYCEAVWSQKRGDLIAACENALHYFGGVPMAIVPDNLKSAVSRSSRNEPVINDEFSAFAEHYGCAVFPARVRHPKDKALVENAVKLMYRSVYLDLEGLPFTDLQSLNGAIRASLEKFNGRPLSGRKQSRKDLFLKTEQDCLRPLPSTRYCMRERHQATVMRNSYVQLNKHHYSVPTAYIGKRLELIYDADTVNIYYGLKLITSHRRDDTPYQYSTKSAHGLPGHHGSYERDLDEVLERAAQIDNIVLLYLRQVAEVKKYPPVAFRSCRGILSLEKKFGLQRLVAACACATEKRVYGYNDVLGILDKGEDVDFMPDGECCEGRLPEHKNIRGREYFASTTNK